MFEDMSTESIKQFQMLADHASFDFVKLVGGLEAIRMLFPWIADDQNFMMLLQRLQQVYSMNGMPFGSFFKEYSHAAELEIKKRERK